MDSHTEKEMDKLEGIIPQLAQTALNQAYNEALEKGLSVVVSNYSEGGIFEIFPNGEKRLIKKIDAPLKTTAGSKIEISR